MARIKKESNQEALPSAGVLDAAKEAFLNKSEVRVEEAVQEQVSEVDSAPEEQEPVYNEPEKPDQPEYSDVELKAIDEGWVPKDQFKGDKNKWRDAQAWVDRTDLYKRLDHQGREMADLKRLNSRMMEILSASEAEKTGNTINDLKQRRREAIINGDVDAVDKLDEAIANVSKKAVPEVPIQTTPVNPPEVDSFLSRNISWFNDDSIENRKMKAYAISIENIYAHEQPNLSVSERLSMVENDIKERFGINNVRNVVSAEPKRASVSRPTGELTFNMIKDSFVRKTINEFVEGQELRYKNIKDKSKMLTRDGYVQSLIKSGVINKYGELTKK
jgi:hypothetical protein